MSQDIGFDPKTFNPRKHLLQGPPVKDPWARAEVWRYRGPFTRWRRFNRALPGFGIALIAFTTYCVAEKLLVKGDHHGGPDHSTGPHH